MSDQTQDAVGGPSATRDWRESVVRGLLWLLSWLPLWLLHGVGALIGRIIALVPNRQRRNALINLALCFPHLSDTELIRLRNRFLREFGKAHLEIAPLWLRSPKQTLGLIHDVRGGELLRRDDGRGLIVLSPHLGAWELAGLYLAAQGPTAIFYKPQKYLDDLIAGARRRSGATLAPITAKGIRALILSLNRGESVGILPDQGPRSDKGAEFAPFFGWPAWTMVLVARLARKTGARVIFMFAERLPRARGFRIHCLPAPTGIDSADDLRAATALNQGIEQCIAVCPDQYLWSYRRFRDRPAGTPKVYTGEVSDRAALQRAAWLRQQAAPRRLAAAEDRSDPSHAAVRPLPMPIGKRSE